MSTIDQQEPASEPPTGASPEPPKIRYYEAEPQDQKKVTVTCHECKMTLDLTISKVRTVQYCLCCGKPAEIVESS